MRKKREVFGFDEMNCVIGEIKRRDGITWFLRLVRLESWETADALRRTDRPALTVRALRVCHYAKNRRIRGPQLIRRETHQTRQFQPYPQMKKVKKRQRRKPGYTRPQQHLASCSSKQSISSELMIALHAKVTRQALRELIERLCPVLVSERRSTYACFFRLCYN